MAKFNGNGLEYVRDDKDAWADGEGVAETTRSIYRMWVADRVVALVSVVNADPQLRIQIGRPNADVTGEWHISDGHAKKGLHEVGGTSTSPGELKDHVDGVTIQAYIYPRLPQIMARLWVPETSQSES